MRYVNNKNERESDSEFASGTYTSTKTGDRLRRLIVLLLLAMSVAFAGAQSVSTTNASTGCELVCGEPYIGADGVCYVDCCPTDPMCMNPCERRVCK